MKTGLGYPADVRLSDGGLRPPCSPLGKELPTEVLTLRLNEHFVSTLDYPHTDGKWAALKKELAAMLVRCNSLKTTLLYWCPKGAEGVDIFVLCPDGKTFAVQTSISALLAHCTVATIAHIPRLFGFSSLERYVFVTVTLEQRGKRTNATLAILPRVRIVSAVDWLRV